MSITLTRPSRRPRRPRPADPSWTSRRSSASRTGPAATPPPAVRPSAPAAGPAADPGAPDGVLRTVRTALLLCAEVDPDGLGTATPAGRALVRLAAAARGAVAGLGGAPGTALTADPGVPGVVVVRDLAAAAALLEAATAPSGGRSALGGQ